MPLIPYRITLYAGLAKVALAFLVVPRFGLNSEAFLLSAFFVISVGLIVWRGLREVNQREQSDLEANPA
jgi:O-antigen/teichoic acid export membrane protein